ncbi:PREDICTED: uncharacterized protein LOC105959301 [Erythranthe guttata]|uniref:uncharacterized protein LOC105959301 n=1 Tax=Erythranthe guttata TaxID=4155 RepID=UPI00064DE357|nr:PREDICTED: uncharacterized protein LOC105959301 [Erythranthe guttata]|eukprot:XP_012838824.1 PREDICTED: uncharacterized protein LOC105959301 [Erythranthe guttata]
MSSTLMIVLKYGGSFGVKICHGDFVYEDLVGFVTDKWCSLNARDVSMTYSVDGYGEGMLGDNDEVLYMKSLIRQLGLGRVEVTVKRKDNVCAVASARALQSNTQNFGGNYLMNDMAIRSNGNYLMDDMGVRSNGLVIDNTQLLSANWRNLIREVGQGFRNGAVGFRDALRKYAVEVGFEFNYVKNEPTRVTAECKYRVVKKCMWRIHASLQKANGFFYIRTFEKHHTCGASFGSSSKNRLTSDLISGLIMNAVRIKPEMAPNDVVLNVKLYYGIDISYFVAWKALAAGKHHVFGDATTSYSYLPLYFEELGRSNPGSVYHLDVDPVSMKFKRCFFAFEGSLSGFKACRPMLALDGTFLSGKHRGIHLSALAKDSENGLFPVAFGIVNEETDDNWAYFLRHLKTAIGTDRVLTFLSDRNHGILRGVKEIFPDCGHIFCLVHLQNNLLHKCRGCSTNFREVIVAKFNACAYAPTKIEFHQKLIELKEYGGAKVDNFIADLPFANWTCSYFVGDRHNEMTSNAAESWNSKIKGARDLPITNFIDYIRGEVMINISIRAEEGATMTTELSSKVHEQVDQLVQEGRVWVARKSSDHMFEVLCDPTAVVDIKERVCSCRMWQITGLPCAHAACVLFNNTNEGYKYVDKYYRSEAYRETYSHPVVPFVQPTIDNNMPIVGPPDHHVRRGRPKSKRIPSKGEKIKRKIKCSRCNRIGYHNKKTCSMAIIGG